jgi:G3E family GTPase
LERVERLFQPDLTIIEPTGLARPSDVVGYVRGHAPMVTDIMVLVLVDATRYRMLLEMLSPLLIAQIQAADIVAINKIDEVNGAETAFVARNVNELNPQARVVAISAEKRVNLELLLGEL